MVKQAAENGASFCKIQTFFADDLSESWKHDYDYLKSVELNWDQHQIFVDTCKQHDVIPMTSVYSSEYLPHLSELGFRHIKIGSAQCCDTELISTYIATGMKVYISTGGHRVEDIPIIKPVACMFHCVSKYPAHPHEANMARLMEIKGRFVKTPLGFSDHTDPLHTEWIMPALTAQSFGVSFYERHFTLLDRDQTRDGKVSIDAKQLKALSIQSKKRALSEGLYFKQQDDFDVIQRYKGRWKPL